jgi:hypothetical protein
MGSFSFSFIQNPESHPCVPFTGQKQPAGLCLALFSMYRRYV